MADPSPDIHTYTHAPNGISHFTKPHAAECSHWTGSRAWATALRPAKMTCRRLASRFDDGGLCGSGERAGAQGLGLGLVGGLCRDCTKLVALGVGACGIVWLVFPVFLLRCCLKVSPRYITPTLTIISLFPELPGGNSWTEHTKCGSS